MLGEGEDVMDAAGWGKPLHAAFPGDAAGGGAPKPASADDQPHIFFLRMEEDIP